MIANDGYYLPKWGTSVLTVDYIKGIIEGKFFCIKLTKKKMLKSALQVILQSCSVRNKNWPTKIKPINI